VSTVFDVSGISIDGGSVLAVDANVDTVTISDVTTVPNVTISVPEEIESAIVEVPGIQGPPGLQNVYIQPNDPAVEFGWGPEQTNYIWIQT
jgi:hypothetical protein